MTSLDEDPTDAAPFWTIPHATVCRVVEALILAQQYQRQIQHVTEREIVLIASALADLKEFSNHTQP